MRRPSPDTEDTYVYVIAKCLDDGFTAPCKVGISATPQKRIRQFQTAVPFRICLYATVGPLPRENAAAIERSIQKIHHRDRLHGEWFSLAPAIALQLIQLSLSAAFVALGGADPSLVPDVVQANTWSVESSA